MGQPTRGKQFDHRRAQTTLEVSPLQPTSQLKKAASVDPSKFTRKPSEIALTMIQSMPNNPEEEWPQITVLRQLARKLTTKRIQQEFSPLDEKFRTHIQIDGSESLPSSPRSMTSDKSEPVSRSSSSRSIFPGAAPTSPYGSPLAKDMRTSQGPLFDSVTSSLKSSAGSTHSGPVLKSSSSSVRSLKHSSSSSEDGGPLLDPYIIHKFFDTHVNSRKRRQISDGGHSRDPSVGMTDLFDVPGTSPFSTVKLPAEEPIDPTVIAGIYSRLGVTEDELQAEQLGEKQKIALQKKLIKMISADIIPAKGYEINPDFVPDFQALSYIFKYPGQFGDLFDFTIDRYLRVVFQRYMRSNYDKVGKKLPNPIHGWLPSDIFDDPKLTKIDEASTGDATSSPIA